MWTGSREEKKVEHPLPETSFKDRMPDDDSSTILRGCKPPSPASKVHPALWTTNFTPKYPLSHRSLVFASRKNGRMEGSAVEAGQSADLSQPKKKRASGVERHEGSM